MKRGLWTNRTFDLAVPESRFPALFERLSGTIDRLEAKIKRTEKEFLQKKIEKNWSIQENIGHLYDLEALWYKRVNEIMMNMKTLTSADMSNQKTHTAEHNSIPIDILLANFIEERTKLLKLLDSLEQDDLKKYSNHPRLNKKMTIVDLLFFVAEHDDHHLAQMTYLYKRLKT